MTRPEWISLSGGLAGEPELAGTFAACAGALATAAGDAIPGIRQRFLRAADQVGRGRTLQLRILVGVLCDLAATGWSLRAEGPEALARAPDAVDRTPDDQKAFVRAGHLLERDAQLAEKSTRSFISTMERRRAGPGGWHSIFSLMRDGRELARSLAEAREAGEGPAREAALQQLIQPYVQVAKRGERCRHTGLDLADIWRYFRHTWSTVYQSTPGRNLSFLIRDAAAPNHPVIGIAALGSSIVQLRVRDEWIGWTGDEFLARLRAEHSVTWARWVRRELDQMLDEIYWGDFAEQGLVAERDFATPDPDVIDRLRKAAAEARRLHRLYPQREQHKSGRKDEAPDWPARARTHLFRSKRAQALADLLSIRRDLASAGFTGATARNLARTLDHPLGRHAVMAVLRRAKARRVGVAMMDITVCGAIAPYNAILGGKLVSLLMAGSEVARAYREHYRDATSVIASGIAGGPISRDPQLVLLGTTSLYGTSPSQYNRVRMPAEAAGGGGGGGEIRYERLGRTSGYGSYHFTESTLADMEVLLARQNRGREVNSIFGEGVNPKLRKVRAALEAVGLPADALLRHGQSRVVYGVPLAWNFRDVLIGTAERARYLLPQSKGTATAIGRYWIRRWVSARIEKPGVLDDVARHTLVYPVGHGARVPVPEAQEELTLGV